MLDVLEGVDAMCPRHGSVSPLYLLDKDGTTHQLFIAPDVVSTSTDLWSQNNEFSATTFIDSASYGLVFRLGILS